jgi:NAD(P)-dependent dehydrogenase (short-subunit alcohol dehydrogenase family)
MKNVLVTGASSGLGRACVLYLAEKGYHVFAGVRSAADGESVRAASIGKVDPILLDVTQSTMLETAVRHIRNDGAGLYGLVNNAGITVAGPIELLPLESIRMQFEVNVLGQLALAKAFLPQLRDNHGRIVLMGSILGKLALPFLAPYSASKFALEAIADSLAMEVADQGVAVSIVEPGSISTPIWAKTKERTRETLADVSDTDWEHYRDQVDSFERYTARAAANGISPRHVAVTVERILGARKPRSRYAVGWDARILGRMAQLIPARLRQALVRRAVLHR